MMALLAAIARRGDRTTAAAGGDRGDRRPLGAITWLPFLLRAAGSPLSDTGGASTTCPPTVPC